MHLEEWAVVHLVDVIAGQDQDRLRRAIGHEVDVLEDRVSGAAVPLPRPPTPEVGLQQAHPTAGSVQVPGSPEADVVHQGARRVLRQHGDVVESRVHRVAEREVDDAVLAAERHTRLGTHLGQDR